MKDWVSKKGKGQDVDIVFSKTVSAGRRIYYLDVKKNRKDELFLSITESKKVLSEELSQQVAYYEKHKIFLFKEDFDKFLNALTETVTYAKENNNEDYTPNSTL
jgi:hypothetical protein